MEVIKTIQLNAKELNAIQALPDSQKSFITAMIDSKILVLETSVSVNSIYEILKRSEISSGLSKIDNKDLVGLAISTYDLIKDNFKNITLTELSTACKQGVIGNYGEWFGMCLKTVNQWIKGYMTTEARTMAIKEWNAKILKQETSDKPKYLTSDESKAGCISLFGRYKSSGNIEMLAFAYYDAIVEHFGTQIDGKLNIASSALKIEISKKIDQAHEIDLIQKQVSLEKRGKLSEANDIVSYLSSDWSKDKLLINRKKTAVIKHYFDQLIKEGMELK